jgi:AsmA-like protein
MGLILILAAATLCVAMLLWSRLWPFTEAPVLESLREASDSQVQVRAFHRTYFPSPGCILEGIAFDHGSSAGKPLITIEKLTIRGTYLRLLSKRVSLIKGDGMRVFIPAFGTGQAFHTIHSNIMIDEIVANGASVEFASHDPDKPPLRFDIHEASLRDVGWKGPLSYRLKVRNPEPPGEVTTSGKFGVWNKSDPGQTPISGEYKFEQADLGVYHGIAGRLSSTGKFGGTLGHIDISGTTDAPDVEVKSGKHPVKLITEFSAYVDGTHGDTFLKRVDAHFSKTHIIAEGSIAKSANGKGKTALIDLSSSNAHIEDILRLFVKADRAPMSGSVILQAKAEIPPGHRRFLEKITLRGSFGIGGGIFNKPSTQEGVNKLSAGARGEKDPADPETVLTDLTGQVVLENGTVRFSDLSFGVPGAAARMHGTYNLISHKIDLRGQLQVDSKISNTASGAKALLLKVMEPFFKKRHKGEVVPVRISGTYEHPTYGLDLNGKNAQKVPPPSHRPLEAASAPPSASNPHY